MCGVRPPWRQAFRVVVDDGPTSVTLKPLCPHHRLSAPMAPTSAIPRGRPVSEHGSCRRDSFHIERVQPRRAQMRPDAQPGPTQGRRRGPSRTAAWPPEPTRHQGPGVSAPRACFVLAIHCGRTGESHREPSLVSPYRRAPPQTASSPRVQEPRERSSRCPRTPPRAFGPVDSLGPPLPIPARVTREAADGHLPTPCPNPCHDLAQHVQRALRVATPRPLVTHHHVQLRNFTESHSHTRASTCAATQPASGPDDMDSSVGMALYRRA